jgi:hypothetical protein
LGKGLPPNQNRSFFRLAGLPNKDFWIPNTNTNTKHAIEDKKKGLNRETLYPYRPKTIYSDSPLKGTRQGSKKRHNHPECL